MDTTGRIEIKEGDLLDALRKALEPSADNPDDAQTVDELSLITGKCVAAIRKALRPLVRAGDVVSFRVRRQAIDGSWRPVPAYRTRKTKAA